MCHVGWIIDVIAHHPVQVSALNLRAAGEMRVSRWQERALAPEKRLRRGRATGGWGEAVGQNQRHSMTGFRFCCRSSLRARMTQFSL